MSNWIIAAIGASQALTVLTVVVLWQKMKRIIFDFLGIIDTFNSALRELAALDNIHTDAIKALQDEAEFIRSALQVIDQRNT